MTPDNPKCPSCGEDFITHLSVIGQCYRLKEAIECVGELEVQIAILTAGLEKVIKQDCEVNGFFCADIAADTLKRAKEGRDENKKPC